jgi:large subunit ribosomal protein L35
MKTHSGAKKRMRVKPSGKVKRRQAFIQHLLECKSSKRKRHLGQMLHVDSANMRDTKRCLVF